MFKRNTKEDLIDQRPNKIFKIENVQNESFLEKEAIPNTKFLLEELK